MKVTGSLLVCCVAALVSVGALVVGAGGAAPASPAAPMTGPVGRLTIQEFAFSSLHVTPGETVLVTNRDDAAHNVTADDGAFDSGNIPGGQAVRFVAPDRPGTYEFICTIHPSMRGQLLVG